MIVNRCVYPLDAETAGGYRDVLRRYLYMAMNFGSLAEEANFCPRVDVIGGMLAYLGEPRRGGGRTPGGGGRGGPKVETYLFPIFWSDPDPGWGNRDHSSSAICNVITLVDPLPAGTFFASVNS